jgi:hypothetical protein
VATNRDSLGARINRALGGLLLLAEPRGIDATRNGLVGLGKAPGKAKGGHGTHGPRSAPPPDTEPIVDEWAGFFRRAAELAEYDLAMATGEAKPPTPAKPGRVAATTSRHRRQRIAREAIYEGRRPEFVAYLEGCSVSLVREARELARLDPLTGFPAERPLTAPY